MVGKFVVMTADVENCDAVIVQGNLDGNIKAKYVVIMKGERAQEAENHCTFFFFGCVSSVMRESTSTYTAVESKSWCGCSLFLCCLGGNDQRARRK